MCDPASDSSSVLSPIGNLANESCGWASRFQIFKAATLDEVVSALGAFVRDSTPEQFRAWKVTVPPLQQQCGRIIEVQSAASEYGAILEYRMPESAKRVDAIFLISGAVLVVEMKGDWQPDYIEQATDYARRLYWFHAHCGEEMVRVHTLLVSYGENWQNEEREFLTLTNADRLHEAVKRFDRPGNAEPICVEKFISPDACRPAPSLVQAVRNYYAKHTLPRIKRIDEITGGAVQRVVTEIRDAHAQKRRKLVLVSGVPGAGKTFVGMQIAHEPLLDDLCEEMTSGEKPTAPAVFLSGNKPLVDVLQYEMRSAGGDGRVFVRGVKEFVEKFSKNKSGPPPHHVLIFDEAQRAWDATKVKASHYDVEAVSEPETFIRVASRIPVWSIVMGLIGDGQQIYTGEEGGIELWVDAIAKSGGEWEVVGPGRFQEAFVSKGVAYVASDVLHLAKSVRFHFAAGLSEWAASIVEGSGTAEHLSTLANELMRQGYQLRITRNLDQAKRFLRAKYRDQPEARFGLMTSGRDKGLAVCGIKPVSTRIFRAGPWYADPEESANSCRRFNDAISEFSAQGLELDHGLLAWGTDFVRKNGVWDDSAAMRYRAKGSVKNPLQLRKNAYRVLLTRGREGMIICLPEIVKELDETYEYLKAAGCRLLDYATQDSSKAEIKALGASLL